MKYLYKLIMQRHISQKITHDPQSSRKSFQSGWRALVTRDKRKHFSILSTLLLYFVGFGFGLGRGRESEVDFLDFVFKEFFNTRNIINLKRVVPGCTADLCRAEMKIPSSQ